MQYLGGSMIRIPVIVAALCGFALASPARAQSGSDGVPEGFRPPRGMCRIWIDGVPAGRQPAPTDCPTAIKRRPANGRVIFGEPVEEPRQGDSSRRSERKAKPDPAYVKKLRDEKPRD
ncbi:MAG TPA: hypothetical protein VJ812_06510 [Gemmatimonadaceae bacterium]|jgi:hypothetical protein|nr:hypothetical protein [Gemmatimonadaceae bacterium]